MQEKEIKNEDILVGLDGSRPSKSAAKFAVQIAQNLNWSVHGIFVIDETIIMGSYEFNKAELGIAETPNSKAELVEWFEDFGEREIHWLENLCHTAHVPVSASLLFGGVPDNLLDNAAHVRFLALGRRGNSHTKNSAHLGQYFQSIARRVRIPILVGGEYHRFVDRMLLAYDGSAAARSALKWAARFQKAMHCQVFVVTVNETSEPMSQWLYQIEHDLNEEGLETGDLIAERSNLVEAILSAISSSSVDLILMGKYSHIRLLKWLFGSKVDVILHQTQCPIWLA